MSPFTIRVRPTESIYLQILLKVISEMRKRMVLLIFKIVGVSWKRGSVEPSDKFNKLDKFLIIFELFIFSLHYLFYRLDIDKISR